MAELKKAVDIYILYRIVKDLSTPFNETDAFKLGLIDDAGKKLKAASTPEEKAATSFYSRFVRNIKRLMSKVGLGGKVATFAAALFLLKEQGKETSRLVDEGFKDETEILLELVQTIKYLEKNSSRTFKQLEEEIANVTGPSVAGTGSDVATWRNIPYKVGPPGERKKKGRYINGVTFLKRVARESAKTK